MDQRTTKILFPLLRSAICGTKLTEDERRMYSSEILQELLKLSARHDISHLVVLGLKKNDLISRENAGIEQFIFKAAYRYERMQYEYNNICNALETAEIPFLPLKGSILRNYYPEPWMRTSCDIDILVKNVDDAVKMLKEKDYVYKGKGSHDVQFRSPLGFAIELHFQLIETNEKMNSVLDRVWSNASLKDGSAYHYIMDPEMFYFYHIAHMAKHFLFGGFGIRSIIDTWLWNEKTVCNEEKKNRLLQEGGLQVFAKEVERLSRAWFAEEECDLLLQEFESFILEGGVFGSKSNAVKIYRTSTDSTLHFLLLRIFMPYSRMLLKYPVLKKYPFLLPVFWIRRWIAMLTKSEKAMNAMHELDLNNNLSNHSIAKTKWILQELELA